MEQGTKQPMNVPAIEEETLSEYHLRNVDPCPWCASKKDLRFQHDHMGESTRIICTKCDVLGPPVTDDDLYENESELGKDLYVAAIRKWNQRELYP